MAIFPAEPKFAGTKMSLVWILLWAKDDRDGGDKFSYKVV